MPYADPELQKAAQRRYYLENKQRKLEAQNTKRALWRRYVAELKEATPCMDCGIQYPSYVMDFDHRPGVEKKFQIGTHMSKVPSMEALKEEIAKCDIVCSNCHRHRTFMRSGKVVTQDS
ncbi:HNH endonuclease [Streptomyces phage Cursive]